MKVFWHGNGCDCGWSVFHWGSKKWNGYHVIHVLGLRVRWGKIELQHNKPNVEKTP